jgi:hypothetical protein
VVVADAIDRGRESFRRRAWGDAFARLSAAEGDSDLGLEDLERLAAAAFLVGRVDDSVDAWARAHHGYMQAGDVACAARCAFWLAFILLNKGELARGGGWVHRAQRLLDDGQRDCVERGYLCYCASLRVAFEGDVEAAHAGFVQAAKIGDRFGDPQLVALGRVGQGRCLIYRGAIAEGVALLDEAMVAVTADEVSPAAVGDLYCTVIEGHRTSASAGFGARCIRQGATTARSGATARTPCFSSSPRRRDLTALVLVPVRKFVGVAKDDLPLTLFEPVDLGTTKGSRPGTLTDVASHVFEIHRERKVLADRSDEVVHAPIRRPDASRRPVEPCADLFPAALITAEGAHDHDIVGV